MAQPNIIFIMADQLAAKHLGCYGNPVPCSPTLDALASRGMRFDRNYATCPVCAPNRATILTGRCPEFHGVTTNNLVLRDDNLTYAQMLAENGYRVGGFGKFHHHPMQLTLPADYAHLGFTETAISEDPKLGPWLDWIEREHPEHYDAALAVSWPMPWAHDYDGQGRDVYADIMDAIKRIMTPRLSAAKFPCAYSSPLPAELHQTTWITDRSIDFIERHQAVHPDQPFFCFTSYVDPHDPYDPPAPYDTMFDPKQMPMPLTEPAGGHTSERLRKTQELWGVGQNHTDPEVMGELRAKFYGSVRFIDDQVARLLASLESQGLMDNTIVIFTTDHGEMLGDFGLMTKGIKPYDAGIRCPLIVAGAGIAQGVTDRLTCSLDFFPSFCQWAHAAAVPQLEGRSFTETCAKGQADDGWETVTVQAPHYVPEGTMTTIVTEDGWRLTMWDEEGAGQLFNLKEDPTEQRDLYQDPACLEKKLELFERMTRAFMQRGYPQQYRNLPLIDGKPHVIGEGWDLDPLPSA